MSVFRKLTIQFSDENLEASICALINFINKNNKKVNLYVGNSSLSCFEVKGVLHN